MPAVADCSIAVIEDYAEYRNIWGMTVATASDNVFIIRQNNRLLVQQMSIQNILDSSTTHPRAL